MNLKKMDEEDEEVPRKDMGGTKWLKPGKKRSPPQTARQKEFITKKGSQDAVKQQANYMEL